MRNLVVHSIYSIVSRLTQIKPEPKNNVCALAYIVKIKNLLLRYAGEQTSDDRPINIYS